MIIVADSSALVALAVCNGLHLLDALYQQVRVPRAVFEECVIAGKPAAEKLRAYLSDKTVDVDLSALVITANGLGAGELQAMALYKHLNAQHLLIDDQRAKKVASLNAIKAIGSLGLLLRAKEKGLIPAIKPYATIIQQANLYLSDVVVNEALRLAKE
jgi:hypothetical protein